MAPTEPSAWPPGTEADEGIWQPLPYLMREWAIRMWKRPPSPKQGIVAGLLYGSELDTDRLRAATADVLSRFDSLRIRTAPSQNGASFCITNREISSLVDQAFNLCPSDQITNLSFQALVEAEADRGYLPGDIPSFRIKVVRGVSQTGLIFSVDHRVADGISFGLILRHFADSYSNNVSRRMTGAPSLVTYALAERDYHGSVGYASALADWQERLNREIPTKSPFESVDTQPSPDESVSAVLSLGPEREQALQQEAHELRCTPTMAMIAKLFRHVAASQEFSELSFLSPMAGRIPAWREETVGNLVNILPVTFRRPDGNDLQAWASAVRSSIIWTLTRQAVPFPAVVRQLKNGEDWWGWAQDQIFISGGRAGNVLLDGATPEVFQPRTGAARFRLSLWFNQNREGVHLSAISRKSVLNQGQLRDLLEEVLLPERGSS